MRIFLLVLLLGAPGLAAQEPVTIGTSYTVPSEVLGQQRRVNVYLPPGYQQGDSAYPVLYLLDGGVHEDFVHIAGLASLAADFRNIRKFIVVGIEGIDRYHDLVHPTTVASDSARLPTAGGSARFREFLARELLPWTARHFRVTSETVLMGESAAGLFVVETLLRQPGLFQGYIAVSPSLWWDGQSLAREAPALLRKPFPPARRLFLTIADEGSTMQEGVDRLVAALRAGPVPSLEWQFIPMAGETHGTTFHPAALLAVRTFFATRRAGS